MHISKTFLLLEAAAHNICRFEETADTGARHANDVSGTASSALLPESIFAGVVASAPLIAIDLIVEDALGAVLLGLRNNPPARGCWFAPGGRIRKNEQLSHAFARIAQDELGLRIHMTQGRFIGIYEHFYDTDFSDDSSASTHYVVLVYHLQITRNLLQPRYEQHSEYSWMQPNELTRHPDVHAYTKAYFLI
jgi:colanic acid biosynthesis protein WcaH